MTTRAEWTVRTLIAAARVEAVIRGDAPVAGLAYDSRGAAPGDLFCCIPGAGTDGHDHAREAVDSGAAALLVERDLPLDVPQARVGHVRDVLGPLSSSFYGHPSASVSVTGVTGTNGKTTVTYLVEAMSAAAGRTAGVVGTVEFRAGGRVVGAGGTGSARTTPEAVDLQRLLAEMRDAGCEVVAMEVTSHALHQRRVDGTSFACAAFTNLTQDHLDYHTTMDAYFDAKARLFDRAFTSAAVLNLGEEHGRRLAAEADVPTVLTYGGDGSDVACETASVRPDGTSAVLRSPAGRLELRTALVGRYNVDNLMCAVGIGLVLRLPVEAIVEGVRRLRNVPGRLERVDAGQPFTVLVDYAHTPDALAHALRAARGLTAAGGRLIVVFGCGGDRDPSKRPVMGEVATTSADLAVVTSDNPRSEDPLAIIAQVERGAVRGPGRYSTEPDRRSAIAAALTEARPGDVVLIAGKGHETGQTFADRTIPFDDRVVARELLTEVVRA